MVFVADCFPEGRRNRDEKSTRWCRLAMFVGSCSPMTRGENNMSNMQPGDLQFKWHAKPKAKIKHCKGARLNVNFTVQMTFGNRKQTSNPPPTFRAQISPSVKLRGGLLVGCLQLRKVRWCRSIPKPLQSTVTRKPTKVSKPLGRLMC